MSNKDMKKYTLRELRALDEAGKLLSQNLGGFRIELIGGGKWYCYKVFSNCKYNWGLYSTPEQELTIGLVRALNRYIREL